MGISSCPAKENVAHAWNNFVPSFCSEHIFHAELYKPLETSILVEMLIQP